MTTDELQTLATRRGYTFDGCGIDVGCARIVTNVDGKCLVTTAHKATADALWAENVGQTIYRQPNEGRLTLAITDRELRRVIDAIEGATR